MGPYFVCGINWVCMEVHIGAPIGEPLELYDSGGKVPYQAVEPDVGS